MRIAIIGTRGIPANYGGFETFAEELSTRLAARGHEVAVYCRKRHATWQDPHYRGVRLIVLRTIPTKHLDTPVHTLLSVLHASTQSFDAVLVCNAANAVFLSVLKVARTPVALNVDGIERLRKKWGRAGRAWYRLAELLATWLPDAVVSDADVIKQYYLDQFGTDSVMIPYGADLERDDETHVLDDLGLRPRDYVLVVTRLEPENNPDLVIRAFAEVQTTMRLVIVGDAPYAAEYKQQLADLAAKDPRVLLTGFLFGRAYRQLQSHAYCFVQATEVGGTHPALIEAMALCGCVIVNGTPENVEVVGDAGVVCAPGSVASLSSSLSDAIRHPEVVESYRKRAQQRVQALYSWERVTDQYELLFTNLADRSCGTRSSSLSD